MRWGRKSRSSVDGSVYWAKLHSNNLLECLNGEIKRRTDIVGIFLNETAHRQWPPRARPPSRPNAEADEMGKVAHHGAGLGTGPKRILGAAPCAEVAPVRSICRRDAAGFAADANPAVRLSRVSEIEAPTLPTGVCRKLRLKA